MPPRALLCPFVPHLSRSDLHLGGGVGQGSGLTSRLTWGRCKWCGLQRCKRQEAGFTLGFGRWPKANAQQSGAGYW